MNYSDTTLIVLLSGVFIPILVGILTKVEASSGLKATLNAGLTAAASLLAVESQGTFDLRRFLVNWSITWVVSVSTYYGYLRPTGVSEQVQEKTSGIGIG